MLVHRFDRRPDLDAAASSWLGEAAASPGRFVALAVGRSTLPVYTGLGPLAGDRVVLALDELVPAPEDEDRRFSSRLGAALPSDWAAALRPFTPATWGAGDVDALAAAVESELAAGGLAAALCGLGPDGHVAFNQPPDPGSTRCRVVRLTPANLARLGQVAPAIAAVTLGTGNLREAGRLGIVVAGEGKEAALRRLLEGPTGPDCPASWLRHHPELEMFVLEAGRGGA